jgi:hypothetical protein
MFLKKVEPWAGHRKSAWEAHDAGDRSAWLYVNCDYFAIEDNGMIEVVDLIDCLTSFNIKDEKHDTVVEYCYCPPQDGASGAYYFRLVK